MGVEFEEQARLRVLLEAATKQGSSKEGCNIAHLPPKNRPDAPTQNQFQAPIAIDSTRLPARSSRGRSSERRTQLRHKVGALIEIVEVKSGNRIEAHLSNLGRVGCYVKTENPTDIGTDFNVLITKTPHSFRAQAKVVHTFPGKGMGLQFTVVSERELQTLDKWLGASVEATWQESNRRRSQRIRLAAAVQVRGNDSNGAQFREQALTASISSHGALVLLNTQVIKGQRLILRNLRTNAEAECETVFTSRAKNNQYEVGVSFVLPNRAFWRVTFPPADWSPRHADAKGT